MFPLALLLATTLTLPAQSDPPPPARSMTLRDALAYAREHQPRMKVARARIGAIQREAQIPRAAWLPSVGATAQGFEATENNTTASYLGVRRVALPRIGSGSVTSSGSFRPYASTLAAVGVDQELFEFGRIAAQTAAADGLVKVEKQRADAETLDVAFAVEEAYFAVFAAKAILRASDDAYDRARAHRDLAKAGVDAGLRSPIELTRAEADLAKLDIGRLRARGGLVVAEQVFAAAVGVPDALLDVAEQPPTPADVPALNDAIEQASKRDPRLLAAFALLRAEEARTNAIGAELRPDLTLTGSFSGRAGGGPPSGNGGSADGDGLLPNVPNWDVGIVLSLPIFDAVVNARQSASRELQAVRREQVDEAATDEVVAIRQAYVSVDVARTTLPGLERAVEAALANYAQADARFRAGMGTSVELADAESVRTDAEIQLALGQFDLARARSMLGRAISEGQ
jgi:outer membrane protein